MQGQVWKCKSNNQEEGLNSEGVANKKATNARARALQQDSHECEGLQTRNHYNTEQPRKPQ